MEDKETLFKKEAAIWATIHKFQSGKRLDAYHMMEAMINEKYNGKISIDQLHQENVNLCKDIFMGPVDYNATKEILQEFIPEIDSYLDEMEAQKNTKITYFVRNKGEFGCFTTRNEVVVTGLLTSTQVGKIIKILKDGKYFLPGQVGLPEVFGRFPDDDNIWFETNGEGIEWTYEYETYDMTAEELFNNFLAIEEKGWDEEKAKWRLATMSRPEGGN